jgi:hypothetical protein
MTGIEGFRFKVEKVDDEHTQRALNEVRKALRQATGDLLATSGRKIVLPEAQRRAPRAHGISASLTVRSRGNSAFITTTVRGKAARIAGLLEYGGTVSAFIIPTRRRRGRAGRRPAVMTPAGPRYIVRGARSYKGRLYMTTAVSERFSEFAQDVRDTLAEEFTQAGIDIA